MTRARTFGSCAITVVWTLLCSFSASDLRAEGLVSFTCQGGLTISASLPPQNGVIQPCINNSFVCFTEQTEISTLSVICRQFNYSVLAASGYKSSALVTEGVSVHCTGRESSLLDCPATPMSTTCSLLSINCTGGAQGPCPGQYQCWSENFCISSVYLCDGVSDCATGIDESNCSSPVTTCRAGDIRLTSGTDYFGRLEMCTSSGSFATVLDTEWNVKDASVACRQLSRNFSGGIPIPVQPGNGPTFQFVVRCNGNETNLSSCPAVNMSLETSLHAVGILCKATAFCKDGDLRLVGGVRVREGQVEVCYNGMWGRICSPSWSYNNAAVVCRQLGYDSAGAIPLTYQYFDAAASPILMDTVYCSGTETKLINCGVPPHLGTQNESQTQTCDSLDHVGVRCDDYQSVGCSEGHIRISERTASGSGKLQLCLNGNWAEFCATGLDSNAANVVCKQLGYAAASSYWSSTSNSQPQAYLVLNCSGSEEGLLQCSRVSFNSSSCFTGSAYVQCSELYVALSPSIPSTYTLQPNQTFHLQCIAVGTGEPRVMGYYNQSGFQMPVGFTPKVDLLNGVQLASEVIYGCTISNKIGTVSLNITLRNANTSRDRSDAFWRGSIPAITRITRVLGSITSTEFLNVLAQHFVNGMSLFLGVWKATCSRVARREIDVARDLDRIECRISSYSSNVTDQVYPPFSTAVNAVEKVQSYVSAQLVGTTQLSFTATAISKFPFCDPNNTTSSQGNYSWPETSGDTIVNSTCAFGPNDGVAFRACTPNGIWQEPDLRYCTTFVSFLFGKLSNIALDDQNVIDVTQTLADGVVKADAVDQSSQSIAYIGGILNQTAAVLQRVSNGSFLATAKQVTEKAVVILDYLQRWSREMVAQHGNRIAQSFEGILTGLVHTSNFTKYDVSSKTVAVEAKKVDLKDAIVNGQKFTASNGSSGINVNDTSSSSVGGVTLASVSLPGSLFSLAATGVYSSSTSIGVLVTVYSTAALFPLRGLNNSFINSPVVGASVIVNSTIQSINGLTDPVYIDLNFTTTNSTSFTNPRCVFWNYTAADGQGNWSDSGCKTVLTGASSVKCVCTHLTNFACLVDIGARTDDTAEITSVVTQQLLRILSIAGIVLSLFGLPITIITLISFKKLRIKDSSKLHIQLCAALFCMYTVFLFGIGLDKSSKDNFGITIDKTNNIDGCVVVSVLVHYFTLVAFMIMASESVLMFMKLVMVFVQLTITFQVVTSLVCWLLPLIPVIVPLAIDKNYLITKPDNITGDGGYCFIGHTGVFFGAFLGPVFAIILFNGIVFVIVTFVLIKHTVQKSKHENPQVTLRLVVSIAGLALLFGLTWSFGAVTVKGARLTFSILFIVLNAFQGFFIFLVFCVFSPDAQQAWKSVLCKQALSSTKTSDGHPTKQKLQVPCGQDSSLKLQSLNSSYTGPVGGGLVGASSLTIITNKLPDDQKLADSCSSFK